MRLETRATLSLWSLALCGGTLAAQTFTFTAPKSVLTTPAGIALIQTADINGDGKTDLVMPGVNSFYNAYLGNGSGGFSTTPISANTWQLGPLGPQPRFMDVNGDGIADQVYGFGTYNDINGGILSTMGQFVVALGDGKGHFTITTSLGSMPTGGGGSDALVAADFNGDGRLDFALLTGGGANADIGTDPAKLTLFLNQGNGKFAQQNSTTLQGSGDFVMTAGDFNGDGKQDLAWTMLNSDTVPLQKPYAIQYLYGNGNGTFGALHTYWTDTQPLGLKSGDLNGDHKSDLVVALAPVYTQTGQVAAGSTWRIATLLAKQAGGFYWYSAISSTAPTYAFELMDLNNDGHLDAIYDMDYLRAGLPGGGWGPHQIVTDQPIPDQGWSFVLPFAPLVKGGKPAVFSESVDSSGHTHLNVQLNVSK